MEWSVRRLVVVGTQAIKILLYYKPFDEVDSTNNSYQHACPCGFDCVLKQESRLLHCSSRLSLSIRGPMRELFCSTFSHSNHRHEHAILSVSG